MPLSAATMSSTSPQTGDVEDIVAADKGIPILVLQLSIGILFSLLQSNVHVAIRAGQHPSVVHSRVELHNHWPPDDLFEEVVRVLPPRSLNCHCSRHPAQYRRESL